MEQAESYIQCVVQGLLNASLLLGSTTGKNGLAVLNEDVAELVVEESGSLASRIARYRHVLTGRYPVCTSRSCAIPRSRSHS